MVSRAGFALVARADCVFTSIGHGGSICTMEMDRSYKSGILFLPGWGEGGNLYLHNCHKIPQGNWSWQNLKIHMNVKMALYPQFLVSWLKWWSSQLLKFLKFLQGLSLTQGKSRPRTALVFGCLAKFLLPAKAIWTWMVIETGSEILVQLSEKKTPLTIIGGKKWTGCYYGWNDNFLFILLKYYI